MSWSKNPKTIQCKNTNNFGIATKWDKRIIRKHHYSNRFISRKLLSNSPVELDKLPSCNIPLYLLASENHKKSISRNREYKVHFDEASRRFIVAHQTFLALLISRFCPFRSFPLFLFSHWYTKKNIYTAADAIKQRLLNNVARKAILVKCAGSWMQRS